MPIISPILIRREEALAKAIRDALRMAEVSLEEVDYINPHGTSTFLNDKVETKVIKDVFGKQAYQIPISSTKSITGHMMGAAGGVEAISVALTLERGMIHPTFNYEYPDPECDPRLCPQPVEEEGGPDGSLRLSGIWRGEQRRPH